MIAIYPPIETDPHWTVWTEPEEGNHDGRCIGVGKTKIEALSDALKDLGSDYIALLTATFMEEAVPTKP